MRRQGFPDAKPPSAEVTNNKETSLPVERVGAPDPPQPTSCARSASGQSFSLAQSFDIG